MQNISFRLPFFGKKHINSKKEIRNHGEELLSLNFDI